MIRSTAVLSLALVVAGLFPPMMAPPGAWSAEEVQPPSGDAASSGSTARADAVRGILSGATEGISANPGAVNILTGTGLLGRLLGFGPDSGVRLGGLWIGDANYLFAGGAEPRTWSFNSLLLVDLSLDLERLLRIPGAQFGVEFLQFNGQPTNNQAGVVAGYNSLPGPPPLDRSQLYELWWRQRLFDDKLIVRIGKTVPTYDFNNVVRPLRLQDESLSVPALSALIYTPIFKNPTLIGTLPGYYNSAYGITVTVAPTTNLYVSAAVYDGNLARGEQTGLRVPPYSTATISSSGRSATRGVLGNTGCPAPWPSADGDRRVSSPRAASPRTAPTASTPSEASGSGCAIPGSTTAASQASSSSASMTRRRGRSTRTSASGSPVSASCPGAQRIPWAWA
jgi:hypothetical protein